MDLVRWNGNDKDKCLTYRTIETKQLLSAGGLQSILALLTATQTQT